MPDQEKSRLNCWIVTEGMAGTENQCLGVTEALGLEPHVMRVTLKQPWRALSPYWGWEHSGSFSPPLAGPWPDLLLTSGRKALAAARYIKRKSGGKTFCVHIQDPRIKAPEIDLLCVPSHDPARGDHVLVTTAAPNRITPAKLEVERAEFPALEKLPSPRVAVLIGGTSKAHSMSAELTKNLIKQLQSLDASLMVTASRRTGAENKMLLQKELQSAKTCFWDGNGPNPYFAMLGYADYILVTEDSVSMLSEACTTGKPVYMIPLEGGAPRIDRLHKNLMNHGALRHFEGTLEKWHYEPLDDAGKIAAEIRKRMKIF